MPSLKLSVIAFALALGACATAPTSYLLKGEAYSSGQEKYDSFFGSVTDLQTRAKEAQGDDPLRKSVALAVGLPESAKLEEAIDGAKSRSFELKKDGSRFFVVVAREPKLIVKRGAEENKDAAAFAKTIEDAIKSGIERGDQLDGLAREAVALEQTLTGLEQDVETSFPDVAKRDQVKLELVAAKEMLENSRLRAGNESGRALRFVVLLASAVDSGAAAELLAMEAGASSKTPKTFKGKPGKGGGKPAKPRPKNDFDP